MFFPVAIYLMGLVVSIFALLVQLSKMVKEADARCRDLRFSTVLWIVITMLTQITLILSTR